MEHFDYLIIGGGPAGYEAAAIASELGYTTALIERDTLGGTCLNRGCIPTKCMCATAQTVASISHAEAMGIQLPTDFTASVDMQKVVDRKNRIVESLRQGIEGLLTNVEIIYGEACFTASKTITVGSRGISAERIIIATGSDPATLDIQGADLTIDSTSLLNLTTLPESLAIIGGGVIGMEFASIFSELGVKISVFEYAREILPQFDRDIAKRLRAMLKQRGVEFHISTAVEAIEVAEGYRKRILFSEKGKPGSAEAEIVLMAVGRKPVIPCGATEAGYDIGFKGFQVNANLTTNIPATWAVGDCNGICQLAHAASAQARMVMGQNVDLSVIPSAVFTLPECAMVGLTSEQCDSQREKAIAEQTEPPRYAEGKAFFRANGKACAMNETEGIVKTIINCDTGLIAGCHICGPHAADLIAEMALAMSARLTAAELLATIHAHPTLSEAVVASVEQAILKS